MSVEADAFRPQDVDVLLTHTAELQVDPLAQYRLGTYDSAPLQKAADKEPNPPLLPRWQSWRCLSDPEAAGDLNIIGNVIAFGFIGSRFGPYGTAIGAAYGAVTGYFGIKPMFFPCKSNDVSPPTLR